MAINRFLQSDENFEDANRFKATVSFTVYGIRAGTEIEAEEQLHNLIDQLATVETDLNWDEVDWTLNELV